MIDNPKTLMHRALPLVSRFYNASGELYWNVNYGDTCTRDNPVGNCAFGVPGEGDKRAASRKAGDFGLDVWDDQLLQGGNGDGQLTYPGRSERIGGRRFVPVASLRLKAIRDGIEDVLYLLEFEKLAGKSEVERFLRKLVRNAYEYEVRPVEWLRVRDSLGEAIEAWSGGRAPEPPSRLYV